MEPNWFMGIYFRPKNNLLPELIDNEGGSVGDVRPRIDYIKNGEFVVFNSNAHLQEILEEDLG